MGLMADQRRDGASEPYRNGPASPDVDHAQLKSQNPPHQQSSWMLPSTRYQPVPQHESEQQAVRYNTSKPLPSLGLGLDGVQQNNSEIRVKRVPVASKEYLTSPAMMFKSGVGQSSDSQLPSKQMISEDITSYGTPKDIKDEVRFLTPQSSANSLREQHPAFRHVSSAANLMHHDHPADIACPTHGDVLKPRWGWLPVTITVLAVFSTIFSGIFFAIAVKKPRWGYSVGTVRSTLSYSNATLLTALFSKLIELSFACVFVATLGQILSRRAFVKNARTAREGGISIAEMNMRLWILQPGTLITHWDGVKYTFKTVLGALALLSALAAALYITAAESLVSPKLAFGKNATMSIGGPVSSIYANPVYLAKQCAYPIPANIDVEGGNTCMQTKYAGQAFRNLDSWMADWTASIAGGEPVLDSARPEPIAMLYDNTTVRGQWIAPLKENITSDSDAAGRLVHNISMAMPHPNVIVAASDSVNSILGPGDLGGAGEYYLQASVPVPALNVLCVGMTAQELQPLLSGDNRTNVPPRRWPVRTAVDELFGWDMATGVGSNKSTNQKPYFETIPSQYNTVVSKNVGYGSNAVYLIATPPNATITTAPHLLCAMRSFIYQNCTVSYHAAQSGAELTAHCDYDGHVDPDNKLPYLATQPGTPDPGFSIDWPEIGNEWLKAVALSHNANASSARELTQLAPPWTLNTPTRLMPVLPSIGEALAVLASTTILLSAEGSPFSPQWNYTMTILDPPKYQYFQALVSYKDYSSGTAPTWQAVFFYPTLFVVFILNLFCLCYLVWMFSRDGEVTDYTEPQNLFALAINSPPSYSLAGACGAGPHGDVLRKKWMVEMSAPGSTAPSAPNTPGMKPDGSMAADTSYYGGRTQVAGKSASHPHFYVRCSDDDAAASRAQTPLLSDTDQFLSPPSSNKNSPLMGFGFFKAKKRTRHRSMADWSVDQSPAVDQYMRLARRA